MSRRGISYARHYEHSDFGDLLSELHGESDNVAMVDGALALVIPSPIVPVSANEESEERHRIMSDQKIAVCGVQRPALRSKTDAMRSRAD